MNLTHILPLLLGLLAVVLLIVDACPAADGWQPATDCDDADVAPDVEGNE